MAKNTNTGKKLGVLFICINLLLLSGCVSFLQPDLGAIARIDARVALVDGHVKNAVFETKDMRMEYTLSSKGDNFDILGKLVFDRSIISSYPVLRTFSFKLNFLGSEGAVLGTISIAPNIGFLANIPDSTQIKASGVKPAGAVAIAFNYYGLFTDSSIGSGGLDDWEAFYLPFD